jgi:uncharacterized membrane protein YfcA
MSPFGSSLILMACFCGGLRIASAAVRSLLDRLLERTLGRIDFVTEGEPAVQGNLREQVNNTPGQLLKLLVARALLKSNRKPRIERLAGFFLASGAAVIGGPVGQDYKQAWTADINQAVADGMLPAVLLVSALSCFISSFQIRWVEKTTPRLRRRFARQYRVAGQFLAAAARSSLSAFIVLTLPATAAGAFVGYTVGHLVGSDTLGWALAAGMIFEVPFAIFKWQRERALADEARRAARSSDTT